MSATKDPFDGMNEAKSTIMKFGKVGDWFKGTLTDNTREIENTLSGKGDMQRIFEFKGIGGSLHGITNKVVNETPDEITPGTFYSFFAKSFMKDQLKAAKIGQIIGLRFTEEKKATKPGFNNTKIIKVYFGEMDPEYKGEDSTMIDSV